MAKTVVKKEICDACGAEIRPGSMFCYNCGGAVSEEGEKYAKEHPKEVNEAWLKADLSENKNLETTKLDAPAKPVEKPLENPTVSELLEKIEEKPEEKEKPSIQEQAKLKSAANLRRKAKSFQRKTIEVVWEEPENAPNKWFPIVAILLILFVVFIFYLAMYVR